MMFSTVVDGFLRYFVRFPIAGVIELNEALIVAVIFLCLSWTQIRKEHVFVELFVKKLPPRRREIVTVIGLILALFVVAALTYQSILAAYEAWEIGDFRQGAVRFPLWPGKATIALGAATLCFQLISEILQGIVAIRSGRGDQGSLPKRGGGLADSVVKSAAE
jgi:TRAP-type mannitol/chloroaromatic compound transport system permease small subunit